MNDTDLVSVGVMGKVVIFMLDDGSFYETMEVTPEERHALTLKEARELVESGAATPNRIPYL